jgi:hypothetical protein
MPATGSAAGCGRRHQLPVKERHQTKNGFPDKWEFEYYGAYCSRSVIMKQQLFLFLRGQTRRIIAGDQRDDHRCCFSETELDIYKQNTKQRLSVSLKKCDFVANRLSVLTCTGRTILMAAIPAPAILMH